MMITTAEVTYSQFKIDLRDFICFEVTPGIVCVTCHNIKTLFGPAYSKSKATTTAHQNNVRSSRHMVQGGYLQLLGRQRRRFVAQPDGQEGAFRIGDHQASMGKMSHTTL